MKFGTFLRLKTPQEAAIGFKKLQTLGFDCCHLVYKPETYTESAAAEIVASAQKNKIEISALFAGYKDNHTKWNLYSDFEDAGINSPKYGKERLEYLSEAANFCKMLGTKNMLIHAGFVANNPFSEEYQFMVKTLKGLALKLKGLGIDLLLETGGESPITLKRLINDIGTDNVYANLDTANLILYGFGNPVDAVYTLESLIHSVHIKDGLPPTNPLEIGRETEFGEGFVDFEKVISLLKKVNFAGPYIIEREISDTMANMKIFDTLQKLKHLVN